MGFIRKFFYVFQNLRNISDKIQLKTTYYKYTSISLVQSIVSYGIENWGWTYVTHLCKIKITLNKLMKLILKSSWCTNTVLIYNDLNVPI